MKNIDRGDHELDRAGHIAAALEAIQDSMRHLVLASAADSAQTNASSDNPWLTLEEASDHLKVSVATLKRWIADGDLKPGQFGRIVRIRRSVLDALLTDTGAKSGQDRADEILAKLGARPNDSRGT